MSGPNQFAPPNANEYGGDEVQALVLDPGYSTTRAGFAGEDHPKSVVPTYYGIYSKPGSSSPTYIFGDNGMHDYTVPNVDVKNPLAGGGAEDWVDDWDAAAQLWEYAITSKLTGPRRTGLQKKSNGAEKDGDVKMDDEEENGAEVDVDDDDNPLSIYPLLMSEPGKTSAKSREKVIEIAMENWEVPAFYLQKTGVLAAFSHGKPTALVVDIGASMIQITPVFDGNILKKGLKVSPLGGNFISQQTRLMFASQQPLVPLVPHFMVKSKIPVDAGQPSVATYRKFDIPATDSFRAFQEERVLHEFKESVVEVWPGPGKLSGSNSQGLTNEDIAAKNSPVKTFEMPDGWNQVFGIERFKVGEALFDEKAAYADPDQPAPTKDQTIPELIAASLNAVDQEVRPHLLANIVIVGAASFQKSLIRRFDSEIRQMFPGPKIGLSAPSNYYERSYASWIGGSILASLGSFHQLWISRKEYEEHGPSIIEKRSK